MKLFNINICNKMFTVNRTFKCNISVLQINRIVLFHFVFLNVLFFFTSKLLALDIF